MNERMYNNERRVRQILTESALTLLIDLGDFYQSTKMGRSMSALWDIWTGRK